MDPERSSCRILMFPWLAHGHIFPFLELAKRILKKKNFHIYLCTTPINFDSINTFIRTHSLQNSIELVPLHFQPNPNLPPHYHTTKNLPPNLNFTLVKAFQTANCTFSEILTTLRPNLVIYDGYQPWAATIASSLGIPPVYFVIVGAATRSFNYHHYIRQNDGVFPFPELCLEPHEKQSQDELMEFMYEYVYYKEEDNVFMNYRLSSEVVLVNTTRALEGKYIDYVSSVCGKKILTVGPLVADANNQTAEGDSVILQWLSNKRENSTVFISFGSEYFLSKEEIEQMAKGLELCDEVNFIWVIRFPIVEEKTTMSIEESLPRGFLDRVGERGVVVTGWAPQADILLHRSTGAFVSHCGWSSLNESVYYGVPVIGIPMKFNMFIDAKMLVHIGACVEVRREKDEVFRGGEIAKAIKKVMVDESGERIRRRVQELSEQMRKEEEQSIDPTAENLWRLCCERKCRD